MNVRHRCMYGWMPAGATIAVGSAVAIALIASPLIVAAPAEADTDCAAGISHADCQFLRQIHASLPPNSEITDSQLTASGHQWCDEMEADAARLGPVQAYSNQLAKLSASPLSNSGASFLLTDAMTAYCPNVLGH